LQSIGFSKSINNLEYDDFSKKIAAYSDYRVAPYGIVSLVERESEGRKRYKKRGNKMDQEKEDRFNTLFEASQRIEDEIFANCKIKPEQVNDKSCEKYIKELREFDV
jgi:hypothetical protein